MTAAIKNHPYFWAFRLPPVGIILSIKAWSRNEVGPGFALLATSLATMAACWWLLSA